MISYRVALVAIGAAFLSLDTWGHVTRVYVTSPYIDVATHLLFGLWFALFLVYMEYRLSLVAVVLVVFVAGIGWEFFEFAYDRLYALPNGVSPAQHGMFDTAKDLASNLIGALGAACMLPYLSAKTAGTPTQPGDR